jgi:hypothetical protein
MTGWSADELAAIGGAEEVQIAPDRADGTPGRGTTIWVVRAADGLYVRSFRGPSGGWYRRAVRSRRGTIRAGGLERRVRFEDAEAGLQSEIDQAYRTKYAAYSSLVSPMVGPAAVATTLQLRPAG